MRPEDKQWIDEASYEELLRIWRFAVIGDPRMQGDTGTYLAETMARKRNADPAAAVYASKRVGWDGAVQWQ